MDLVLKLFLSHILGDFVLQPNSWVADKKEKKYKSRYLYVHILLHAVLAQLFVGSWLITAVVAISHGAIDILKLQLQKNSNERQWFFFDQLLHLLVLAAIVAISTQNYQLPVLLDWIEQNLPVITGAVFLTTPCSILIKTIISRWEPTVDSKPDDSLQKAGAYIGILERLFVFTFALSGQWEAVGFLIAAKSVFRFGDLKDSNDRKLTEYILIGTLLSVGLAAVVGLFVSSLF